MSAQVQEQGARVTAGDLRVLVIGQPGIFVDGIVQILESSGQGFSVSCVSPGEPCTQHFVAGHPHYLLVQDNAKPGHFEEFIAELVQGFSGLHVIVFGQSMTDDYLFRVINAGARGYFNERMNGDHILRGMQAVGEGQYWVERHIMEKFIAERSLHENMRLRVCAMGDRLTRRETEVLSLVMEGMSTSEISERIFLSHQGVKAHLTTLFRKFNVKNRPQLILKALDEVSPVARMTKLVQQELQASRRVATADAMA